MMESLHSFVIPAYGDSPFLEACIRSLQSQTRPSPILICTSTPSAFIESIATRAGIHVIVNPHRSCMADDWIFAYRAAQTPYVTLAHQDDEYLPAYTQTLLGAIERTSDATLAFCDYAERIGERIRTHRANLWIKRTMLRGMFGFSTTCRSTFRRGLGLSLGCPICCPSVMLHKRRLGDFAFDPRYRFVPDWDAWLRIASHEGAFVYVRERLVHHRLHPQSETSRLTASPQRAAEELEMLCRCWPRPVARLIALAYRLGHLSNRTE